ncbi:OmpA family protein [Acetobacteraceae bacterium KSS8]|uniref:OmpA family protein n=1 Tax=Endosaccharibacter trunci TaxID=2812733 RepID=A0ABT1WA70_9PROT|nr:OmpA family protein [Acetobacteraceae bacterium KSS8]
MAPFRHCLAPLAATLALIGGAAASAATISGPYVSLGAGYNILQDTRTFFPAGTINPGPSKRTYRWGEGFDAAGAAGWGFGNGLRLEVEGSNFYNTVNNRVHSGVPSRTTGNADAYGAMVNVLYDVDLARFGLAVPITPFIGAGVGYQWNHLSPLTSVSGDGAPIDAAVSRVGGTNGSFAYQGIVGAAYDIAALPGLAITAEYRFLGTDDETESAYHVQNVNAFGRREGPVFFGDRFNHSVMLGVRYAFDTAPPPPPPPPVVPAAPPAEARTYLVFFDWDRSDLTPRAREIVAQAAQASTHVQTTRIEVNGYTDNSSIHGGVRGARYNMGLSIRRAQSVKAELIRDGVPGSAIDIHGYGETHPLVATGPNTREPQNRRVEIILH